MNGMPTDRRRIVIGAAAVVGLAGLLFGGWAWWQSRSQVSTDDAYVEGAVAIVAAKVMGNVVEMLVQDNQQVKAGDVLLRLDPRDFKAKRDQAAAAGRRPKTAAMTATDSAAMISRRLIIMARASHYFRPSCCLTVGQSRLSARKAARSGQRRNGLVARSRPIVELGRTP